MQPTSNISLKEIPTNELLNELQVRGEVSLYPSNDTEELKIKVFSIFWKHLSVIELYDLLSIHVRRHPTQKQSGEICLSDN